MDASQPNNHGFETTAGPQKTFARGRMKMDICALEPLPTRSKKRIGEPLILPNGIGINYAARSAQSLTPSLHPGDPDSGYSSVTNTDSKSPSLAKCTPEPHDLPSSLPPRHRHPKNRQLHSKDGRHEDMLVEEQTVTLHHLLPEITADGLRALLYDIGFTAPFVVKSMEDHSISLEFSHSNIATVAFSLLQHRAASLFARTSGSISSGRLFQPYVIDLTKAETSEDTVNNLSASKSCPPSLPDSDSIYGDIGAYDASGMESTDSEASVTSVREIQKSSASSQKYHSRSENEDLGKTLGPPDSRPRVVNSLPNGLSAVPQPPNRASFSIPKTLRDSASPSPATLAPETENNEPHIQIVNLPQAAHNRARRVLLPNNKSLPTMTVSMRADFQFFHRTARHRISRYSMPNNYSDRRHTSDAVMIGDFAAVGYRSSPCQVSLIHSREGQPPLLTELDHKPHNTAHNTHATAVMGGVNCLTAKRATANAIQFFTGGYDRTIRLWSVTTPDLAAQTERLTTLSTIPHALAFRDRMLLVGTSKKILALDLGHLSAKPIAAQLSNSIHQIHVHKQAPNVIILEVDSLDSQVQIFDVRKQRGFDRTPDCNFGARCGSSNPTRSMNRGDTEYSLFAKGFADGTVRVWDYRNSKQPVLTKAHQNMGAVAHTVFTETGNILCYNGDSLIFVDSREVGE